MPDPFVQAPGLRVSPAIPEAQWLLHCSPEDAPSLALAAGISLPLQMLRSEETEGVHALHLAPDEWLLIAPAEQSAGLAARFEAAGHLALSLVDIGERSLGVDLGGERAADLVNAGCPLDLRENSFPAGSCSRTLLGKAAVMLWRLPGQNGFRLQYGRSFDDYVTAFIRLAAQDLPEAITDM